MQFNTRESLITMRKEYSEKALEESQIQDGKPFLLFKQWLEEAVAEKVTEPNAVCLSTVQKSGRPSSRYVLLKSFDEESGTFTWYSNYNSRKGEELEANPYAALVFWWGDLERSVRVEGKVEKVAPEISDAYFQRRPRDA